MSCFWFSVLLLLLYSFVFFFSADFLFTVLDKSGLNRSKALNVMCDSRFAFGFDYKGRVCLLDKLLFTNRFDFIFSREIWSKALISKAK